MASDTALVEAITKLIERWRDSETEPPFTQEQIISMALLLTGDQLTSRQIIQWQASTFKYYGVIVSACFYDQLTPRDKPASNHAENRTIAARFVREHRDILKCYNFPIAEHEDYVKNEDRYSMTTSAAYSLLHHLVAGPPKGTFRFFDLPAELRTRIYDMLLRFPPSGFGFGYSSGGLSALTRDFSKPFAAERMAGGHATLRVRDFSRYLNLLLVNKQMHQEAVHCLYSINTFFVSDVGSLKDMLGCLAPSRRRFLRHLATIYTRPRNWTGHREAFNTLASLAHLRKLDIWIDESWFAKHRIYYQQLSGDDIKDFNVPGLQMLRTMRHRTEITLHGDCPNISVSFKAEPILQAEEEELQAETVQESEIRGAASG